MLISVIIPTLNESKGIYDTIVEIPRNIGYDIEIIVVDGGSIDGTDEIARKLGAKVILEPKRGYGRAYKTGFQYCKGEIIVTLDGDNTYPSYEIPRLIQELINNKLDFISTNRFAYLQKDAMDIIHRIGNYLLTLAVRILFSLKINDSQSGMWIFRKEILDKILPIADGMAFSEEIKIRAFIKCKSKELPIIYRSRRGKKKISTLKDGLTNLVHLFRLLSVRL